MRRKSRRRYRSIRAVGGRLAETSRFFRQASTALGDAHRVLRTFRNEARDPRRVDVAISKVRDALDAISAAYKAVRVVINAEDRGAGL